MVTPARGQLGPDILASDPGNAERRRMEELADKLLEARVTKFNQSDALPGRMGTPNVAG